MGRDGRYREYSLPSAISRRKAGLRHLGAKLRAGGRHRLLGTPLRVASSPQRSSNLFSVGTARLFGELSDRARRFQKNTGGLFRTRRIRGQVYRQPLRNGARDPGVHLPWRKVRDLGRYLAAVEEMALTIRA